MGCPDEGFLGGGREWGVGEFGEGAGEGGLVRELVDVIPAAQLAQTMVGFEGFEELAGVSQAVDAFGQEGTGDGEAVFAGATGPAALREQGAERDHGADGDEECGAVADGADGGSEEGEELLLEDVGELGELLGEGELPVAKMG